MQHILETLDGRSVMLQLLAERKVKKYFLVYDQAIASLALTDLTPDAIPYASFCGFTPNPRYEEVMTGLDLFRREQCEAIVALGGGSCIDVAKCIKLYNGNTALPLIALPTTAGTGSESTRFAVIYKEGVKQSVTDPCIVPDVALLDCTLLRSLPPYQRKCGALDALCHAVESLWSVNATPASQALARQALGLIREHLLPFVQGAGDESALMMMRAANLAGQAISISQTTAAHAMSYKLTSLFHIAHGHAAALCLPEVMDHLEAHGDAQLRALIAEIHSTIDVRQLLAHLHMEPPRDASNEQIATLVASVNPTRLANSPVPLSEPTIRQLYLNILHPTT